MKRKPRWKLLCLSCGYNGYSILSIPQKCPVCGSEAIAVGGKIQQKNGKKED